MCVATQVRSCARSLSLVTVLMTVLAAVGCAAAELAPAPGASVVDAKTGRAVASDVELQATVGDWKGRRQILEHVTPIRITIDNTYGSAPVRVRFTELELVTADGETLAALPPYLPRQKVAVYSPVNEPGFTHASFSVAPHAAYLYPSLPAAQPSFDYESLFFERYTAFWQETGLPTHEMLEHALPEGDVEVGGMASGFVYFEPLRRASGELELRARIVNAETGLTLGRVSIPFVVR